MTTGRRQWTSAAVRKRRYESMEGSGAAAGWLLILGPLVVLAALALAGVDVLGLLALGVLVGAFLGASGWLAWQLLRGEPR